MYKHVLKQWLTQRSVICLALVLLALAAFLALVQWSRAGALLNQPAIASSVSIHTVPGSDESLYVAAGRLGQLAIPVYANVKVFGPTSYERSHTMDYDPGSGEYGHIFEGLFYSSSTVVEGTILISTTGTPVLGSSPYIRYKVAVTSSADLPSTDGWVNLHINPGGVPTDTYVLIMPTNVPPGDPPPGHRIIGQAYSIRASGALSESLQPMTLRMSYHPTWLTGIDTHTLSLFAWYTGTQQWLDLGGTLFFDYHYLSSSVQRFTTYALMATTTWRDTFLPLVIKGTGGPGSKGAEGQTGEGAREQRSREAEEQGGEGVHASTPQLGMGGCEPASTPPIEWSPPINISDNAGTSLSPALAADVTGTLHAVWYDNSSGNLDILYASKGPEQEDWSAPVIVSNTPGSSYWPAIAVDGQGNVHVAWEDGSTGRDILYTMKPAGGAGWAEPVNISQSPGDSRWVALAADADGNVHAVWSDNTTGNSEIYYARKEADAPDWSAPANVSNTPGNSPSPAIAVDGSGTVHVAWHDFTPGPTEIYYVTKPNPTTPWSSPMDASRTTGASYFPALAVDSSGTVHLVWMDAIVADYGAPFEVLYARKPPGGEWTPYVNLSQGTGSAEMPTLAVGPEDALHVAWDTTTDPRLLYMHRPAPEMGWTAPVTVTTIPPGTEYPASSIAIGPTETVHLLWSGFGPLSRDILYSTAAPPPIPENHVLVLDEEGFAVVGACVYQNGVPTVATDDSGIYVPSSLAVGDTLVAFKPLTEQLTVRNAHATPDSQGTNWAYRIGVTSMDVDGSGNTHPHVVTQMGQQRLVVRKTNPLVLYNLLVSIQWDATLTYTHQVSEAVRRASNYLYDVTDGQFAFGHVAIYDNANYWSDADIQLAARSNVRPYAFVGGITSGDKAWTIRVGRGWDRRADSSKPWNNPDGFQTLVHEFSHYGLYLYDEYFEYTFDGQGHLTGESPSHCTGPENRDQQAAAINASIMDWQYTSSELAARGVSGLWTDDWCTHTVQWQLNNESDWETVTRYYTDTTGQARWALITPANRGAVVPGPDSFPHLALPFPTIVISNTGTDAPTRTLTVLGPGGARYPGAIVALDPASGSAIDQGFTDQAGEITILGAAKADTVRAMSLDGALSGAVMVTQSTAYTLSLGWAIGAQSANQNANPYVSLIPGSDGRTLYPSVQGVERGGALSAMIFQPGNADPQMTQLSYSPEARAYTGTLSFSEVSLGTGGLYVRGLGPQGQLVAVDSSFSLLEVDSAQAGDLYSADGNLQLHLDESSFPSAKAYAVLMPSGAVPQPLPPGRQVVGDAYAIRFSGALTETVKPGVLKLFYHPEQLASGTDPHTQSIYRWNASAAVWEFVGGELDEWQRSVAVTVDRIGIYALMAAEGPLEWVYLPIVVR